MKEAMQIAIRHGDIRPDAVSAGVEAPDRNKQEPVLRSQAGVQGRWHVKGTTQSVVPRTVRTAQSATHRRS